MAEHPNHIFVLTAISRYAQEAFKWSHNREFYVPPSPQEVTSVASRESTPATNVGDDDDPEMGDGGRDFFHRLQFTFDRKPKNPEQGWVFGSNPKKCDVIIGKPRDGVSASHFRITLDDQDGLVLIDQSTHGTAVSYNGQAWKEKRKNPPDRTQKGLRDKLNDFVWILFPKIENKRIIIGHEIKELPNAPVIEFSVEVAAHNTCKEQYETLRDAYLDEMRTTIPFGLDINSHLTTAGQTELNSPKHCPKQRPIWIDVEDIGRGEFGTVCRSVNVSTGVTYATKTLSRGGKDVRMKWDREVAILRSVSHHHIVKFENHDTEHTWPRLIMEYLPLGNLADQNEISRVTEWETVTLLCQGLDALDYLHSRGIVHRDIKPENILVQCREPTDFCVKLADFGLAKDESFLRTCCGTQLYAAPEIWSNQPYTVKIDVWSMGVIAFQYAYGLPEVPMAGGHFHPESWYQTLAGAIDDWDSDQLLDFLASSMLKVDPGERLAANECLEMATEVRKGITPAQNLGNDPGTPTEAMSSSAIMRTLKAAGYGRGQQESAKSLDFPTLTTITQIWHPPAEERYGFEEEEQSQQLTVCSIEKQSFTRPSKRQRTDSSISTSLRDTTPEIITSTLLSHTDPRRNLQSETGSCEASQYLIEWEGDHLRPLVRSEVLEERRTGVSSSVQETKVAPSPKACETERWSRHSQDDVVGPTAGSRHEQEDGHLLGPEGDQHISLHTDTQAYRRRTQDSFPAETRPEDGSQAHRLGGMHIPSVAVGKSHLGFPNDVLPFDNHTTEFRKSSSRAQQQTMQHFRKVTTTYGPIHLLFAESATLVNVSNITAIYGNRGAGPLEKRVKPVQRVTGIRKMPIQGSYFNVKTAMEYCKLLHEKTTPTQVAHAYGPVIQEKLLEGIQRPEGLPEVRCDYFRSRCKACARRRVKCDREDTCGKCLEAGIDCLYPH